MSGFVKTQLVENKLKCSGRENCVNCLAFNNHRGRGKTLGCVGFKLEFCASN